MRLGVWGSVVYGVKWTRGKIVVICSVETDQYGMLGVLMCGASVLDDVEVVWI